MKVAKLVAPRRMELFEEPDPVLQPGQVLVRVAAVGICGSDLHYFRHGGLGTHMSPMPMELGHEVSGTVVASESRRWVCGDIVAVDPLLPCWDCQYCREGRFNLCHASTFLGAGGQPGGLREKLVVSEWQLAHTQDSALGFLWEPLSVAQHAVNRWYKFARKALIIGAGPIGFLIGRELGFPVGDALTILDTLPYRQWFARRTLGATGVYKPGIYDIVFDAAGTQDAIDMAFDSVRRGGAVVLVGIPEADLVTSNPHVARIKELDVFNVRRSKGLGETSTQARDLTGLVTHRFPLSRVQEAFEVAADYKDNAMKVVVEPGAE